MSVYSSMIDQFSLLDSDVFRYAVFAAGISLLCLWKSVRVVLGVLWGFLWDTAKEQRMHIEFERRYWKEGRAERMQKRKEEYERRREERERRYHEWKSSRAAGNDRDFWRGL
jgi:hypothetical protein